MPFAVLGFAAGSAVLGCSAPEALGGQGAPCALTTDCQEGLVCISLMNGPRQCSNDLAAIQFVEDSGGAEAAEAGAEIVSEDATGSTEAGAAPASPFDSGATSPDATAPDAGEPQEAAPSNDGGEEAALPDDAG